MASNLEDLKFRWTRLPCTLQVLARICCGWNQNAWEIPDAALYNRVLARIRLGVKLREFPIVDDQRYTADDPEPPGHVWHDFDPVATDDEQVAARAERERQRAADAPETLVWLKDVWQWALWQFPDTCHPFTAADFQGRPGVQHVASEPTGELTPLETGIQRQGTMRDDGSAVVLVDPVEVGRRAQLLAEYKNAVGGASDLAIYSASNSNIHKPEFMAWKNGTLSRSSATTENFERFLREKRKPIPKTPHPK